MKGGAVVRKTRYYIDHRRITRAAELFFHLGSRFVIVRGFHFGDVVIHAENIPRTFFTIYEESENSVTEVENDCNQESLTNAISYSGRAKVIGTDVTLPLNTDSSQKQEPFGISVSAILSLNHRFRGTCSPSIWPLKSISAFTNYLHEECQGENSKTQLSFVPNGSLLQSRSDHGGRAQTNPQLLLAYEQQIQNDMLEIKQGTSHSSANLHDLKGLNSHPTSTPESKCSVNAKLRSSNLQENACLSESVTSVKNRIGIIPSENTSNNPELREVFAIKENSQIKIVENKEMCEVPSNSMSETKSPYLSMAELTAMFAKNIGSKNDSQSKIDPSVSVSNPGVPLYRDINTCGKYSGNHSSEGAKVLSETKVPNIKTPDTEKSLESLLSLAHTSQSPYLSLAEVLMIQKNVRLPGKDARVKDTTQDVSSPRPNGPYTPLGCEINFDQITSNGLEISEICLEQNSFIKGAEKGHDVPETVPCSKQSWRSPYISLQEIEKVVKKNVRPSAHEVHLDKNTSDPDVSIHSNKKIQDLEPSDKGLEQTSLQKKSEKEETRPVRSTNTSWTPYISLAEFEMIYKNKGQPPTNDVRFKHDTSKYVSVSQILTKTQPNTSAGVFCEPDTDQITSNDSEISRKCSGQKESKKGKEENETPSEPTLKETRLSHGSYISLEEFAAIQKMTIKSPSNGALAKNESLVNPSNTNVPVASELIKECCQKNCEEKPNESALVAKSSNLKSEVRDTPPEPPPRPAHTFRKPYISVPKSSTVQTKNVHVPGNDARTKETTLNASTFSENSNKTLLTSPYLDVLECAILHSAQEFSARPSRTDFSSREQRSDTVSQTHSKKCEMSPTCSSTSCSSVSAESPSHLGGQSFLTNLVDSERMTSSNTIPQTSKFFAARASTTISNQTNHMHIRSYSQDSTQSSNRTSSDSFSSSMSGDCCTPTIQVRSNRSPPPPPSYPAPTLPQGCPRFSTTPKSSIIYQNLPSLALSSIAATHRAFITCPPPPSYPAPTLPREFPIHSYDLPQLSVNSCVSSSLKAPAGAARYVQMTSTPSKNSGHKTTCNSEPFYENLLFLKSELAKSGRKLTNGNTNSKAQLRELSHKNESSNNSDSLQSTSRRNSHLSNITESSNSLFPTESPQGCSKNANKSGKKKSSFWSIFKKKPTVVKADRTFVRPVENPQRRLPFHSEENLEQRGYPCKQGTQEGCQKPQENKKRIQGNENTTSTRNPLRWFTRKSRTSN